MMIDGLVTMRIDPMILILMILYLRESRVWLIWALGICGEGKMT